MYFMTIYGILALIVYLAAYNRSVAGLVPAPVQWLAISVSLLFPFFLAFVGYNTQPVVDFRPFKLGTQMFHPADYGADTFPTVHGSLLTQKPEANPKMRLAVCSTVMAKKCRNI